MDVGLCHQRCWTVLDDHRLLATPPGRDRASAWLLGLRDQHHKHFGYGPHLTVSSPPAIPSVTCTYLSASQGPLLVQQQQRCRHPPQQDAGGRDCERRLQDPGQLYRARRFSKRDDDSGEQGQPEERDAEGGQGRSAVRTAGQRQGHGCGHLVRGELPVPERSEHRRRRRLHDSNWRVRGGRASMRSRV